MPGQGRGEVLVNLRAAALNAMDLMVVQGNFPGVEQPLAPVADAAGETGVVHEGVTKWVQVNRIIVHFMPYNWLAGAITSEKYQYSFSI